jgi:hypothetical protein
MDAAEVIAHIGWTQGNQVTTADVVAAIRWRPLPLLKTRLHRNLRECENRNELTRASETGSDLNHGGADY